MKFVMDPIVARLVLLSLSNAPRMLNAASARGATLAFVLWGKIKATSLVNPILIVRTTKFARVQFALLVTTLPGYLTTEPSDQISWAG